MSKVQFKAPQPLDLDIKVWRYLDLAKLISILAFKKLYLTRLDQLGDAYEGSYTRFDIEKSPLYNAKTDSLTRYLGNIIRYIPRSTYVSCWRMGDYESEAMWKLYCPDNKGIALQTTYSKLSDSIQKHNLIIGVIKYIDYEQDKIEGPSHYSWAMHKRKSFEHEQEVRIITREEVQFPSDTPLGKSFDWSIDTVIENIYVNPYAQEWFFDAIRETLRVYSCNATIKWSQMKSEPRF